MAHYDEAEFEQSGGGKWMRVIGIIVYIAIILAYAWQTLELVGWLFPGENWFMKVVTVFVCDGCATGYAMTEMFYRFKLRWSKQIVFGMWILTFVFSTVATVIQMYLASTNNIPHAIDPGIVTTAYGIIIAAFVVNIIAITIVIRMEYNAGQPPRRYLDDKPKKAQPRPSQPVQTQIHEEKPAQPALPAPGQLTSSEIDYDRLAALLATHMQPVLGRDETMVAVKPARFTPPPQQEIDTEDLGEANDDEPVSGPGADDEEEFETVPVRAVSSIKAKEATSDDGPLDRVAGSVLDFLAGSPKPVNKLQHKPQGKSKR